MNVYKATILGRQPSVLREEVYVVAENMAVAAMKLQTEVYDITFISEVYQPPKEET